MLLIYTDDISNVNKQNESYGITTPETTLTWVKIRVCLGAVALVHPGLKQTKLQKQLYLILNRWACSCKHNGCAGTGRLWTKSWTMFCTDSMCISFDMMALQWRHNGLDGVSNHQPHHCRLFGRRSKKTSKLHITGLCAGNSPGTGEFPAQITSNAEYASTWWRHHGQSSIPWLQKHTYLWPA